MLVAERGRVRISRYWDLEFTGDGDAGARRGVPRAARRAAARSPSRLRQISDVPLGAFLSGGIDSSDGRRLHGRGQRAPPVTISVGFDHERYDEVAHAETVARHLGCEFHPLVANPQVDALLPKLAWHFDEPFADSSAVPTYYVSKAARELVTVALSGDGGDELWAGYARHRVEHWEQRARALARPGAPLSPAGSAGRCRSRSRGRARCGTSRSNPDQAYALKHAYGMFEPDAKTRLYSRDFAARGAATPTRSPASATPIAPARRSIRWIARSTSTRAPTWSTTS